MIIYVLFQLLFQTLYVRRFKIFNRKFYGFPTHWLFMSFTHLGQLFTNGHRIQISFTCSTDKIGMSIINCIERILQCDDLFQVKNYLTTQEGRNEEGILMEKLISEAIYQNDRAPLPRPVVGFYCYMESLLQENDTKVIVSMECKEGHRDFNTFFQFFKVYVTKLLTKYMHQNPNSCICINSQFLIHRMPKNFWVKNLRFM